MTTTINAIPRDLEQLQTLIQAGKLTESQARVIACVNHFNGYSLKNHETELRAFIARQGVDNPKTLLDPHVSDCGLFALAVWHALGVPHKLVKQPYVIGFALAWLYEIARDREAIRHPAKDGPPKPGSLMHYFHNGKTDNHVEFCLSEVQQFESVWVAFHSGGGRPNCAISAGHSDIRWSSGRPLQEWYDIDALMAPAEAADEPPSDENIAESVPNV
jgi:hypothetical protein